MSKLRIGFVGVGNMGQAAHLRNYATLEDCEVVAIAEIRQKTGRMVAERYGVARVYQDHREMLAAEMLDGVVASQPFNRHALLLPEIYPRVKHLLTEKPLAVAPEAGRRLSDAAAAAGCTHVVGYHKRSDPATEHARGLIDQWKADGRCGPLKYVRICMPAGEWIANGFVGVLDGGDERPALETEPQMEGMDEATGGAYVSFVNYYIHQVNLMRHLLGEPYRVTYAEATGVLLAVQADSGTAGIIEMTPYRTTVEWEESALVAFEKGYIMLRLPAPLARNRAGTVEIYEGDCDGTPVRSFPTMPWIDAMRNQAMNFLKVCRGQMKPPCDAAEAVEDLDVAREYIRLRFGK